MKATVEWVSENINECYIPVDASLTVMGLFLVPTINTCLGPSFVAFSVNTASFPIVIGSSIKDEV